MEQDTEASINEGSAGGASMGEDGGEVVLSFEDESLVSGAMEALNTMRKNKHFCDVVLHTGCAEVPAHRAVLAAASPYLFELFTTDQDRTGGSGAVVLPLSYKLSGPCERKALLCLVDYAYTGKLSVPAHQVRSVYLCAWQLRMDEVVKRCGRFLAGAWLARDTCLSVRALPGLHGSARCTVDKYIAENFSSLYKSSTLSALPLVQVEVLYTARKDMDLMEHSILAELLLQWLRDLITDEQLAVSSFVGRTHLLYIAGGRGLRDCAGLPPAHSDTQLLQEYRRMLLKCPPTKNGKRNGNGGAASNGANGNGGGRSAVYSRDIMERAHRQPGDDWAVIASEKVAEHTFLSLSALDGHLALLSASLRLNESPLPSPLSASVNANGVTICASPSALIDTSGAIVAALALAQLESPRCAHGMAVMDGKLIVCGGYDRYDCLNSVESYDPERNRWTRLPDMRQQRGRFNIAQIGDRIYAVGGSDGHLELDSVEMYQREADGGRSMSASLESQSGSIDTPPLSTDEHNGNTNGTTNGTNGTATPMIVQRKKAWSKRAKLPLARSYAGVCSGPEGRLFCVGGWAGQAGVRDCHVYNTQEDQWTEMAPLNAGRSQSGVCVWGGALWAVGGCDAWRCLTSTELFGDINSTELTTPGAWHFGPSLSVPRRGCGVAAFGTYLACVGGSDGQHSLKSVELLDAAGSWEAGPPLREARAGLALASLGDRLYAVGGFSGKLFLSTMEYLAEGTDEWTSFTLPFPTQLFPHDITSRGPSPAKNDDKTMISNFGKIAIATNGSAPSQNGSVASVNGAEELKNGEVNGAPDKHEHEEMKTLKGQRHSSVDSAKDLNGSSDLEKNGDATSDVSEAEEMIIAE